MAKLLGKKMFPLFQNKKKTPKKTQTTNKNQTATPKKHPDTPNS